MPINAVLKTIALEKKSDHVFYKEKQFYSSFPAITRLANNDLLLVFRRARDVRSLLFDDGSANEELEKLKSQVDHIDSRSQLVAIRINQSLQQLGEPTPLTADPEAGDQDVSLLLMNNGQI